MYEELHSSNKPEGPREQMLYRSRSKVIRCHCGEPSMWSSLGQVWTCLKLHKFEDHRTCDPRPFVPNNSLRSVSNAQGNNPLLVVSRPPTPVPWLRNDSGQEASA